ncbi:kinase-like protein [Dendrothele bispora CBS 962.96]|uniref:Kinase-like protein n=1 Tax=Dendrothele bispora (strain CBS 962.96) TaxID=1314807 RepID=A0A4S8MCK6_DENBC|nr:kinase-like protein [Dendrothele bispora CBS 962.96]
MPYYPHNLAELLNDKTVPVNWDTKVRWALSIAEGISTLHSCFIFCRDLWLENILVSKDGHVSLIDVALLEGYCYPYNPPEFDPSFLGSGISQLTGPRDVYALGMILWVLAMDKGIFGDNEAPRSGWKENFGETPSWYIEMVNQCLAADPKTRPSVEQLIHTIQDGDHV